MAPKGLIEFIPLNDEKIIKMIKFKGNIFTKYSLKNFISFIKEKNNIVNIHSIPYSKRKIIEFIRS